MQYKKAAIGAVLARVFIRFTNRAAHFGRFGPQGITQYPLSYAAIIAEWDPILATGIIDVSMGIDDNMRARFKSGEGERVDLVHVLTKSGVRCCEGKMWL